eukprot:GHVH01004171.1.p1 GENE.GHVH01004171.1~~GHVH01004171.1.p1  ORF type:complete len:1086 (+),score=136.46 GHVH01004171.1:36-3293(+)
MVTSLELSYQLATQDELPTLWSSAMNGQRRVISLSKSWKAKLLKLVDLDPLIQWRSGLVLIQVTIASNKWILPFTGMAHGPEVSKDMVIPLELLPISCDVPLEGRGKLQTLRINNSTQILRECQSLVMNVSTDGQWSMISQNREAIEDSLLTTWPLIPIHKDCTFDYLGIRLDVGGVRANFTVVSVDGYALEQYLTLHADVRGIVLSDGVELEVQIENRSPIDNSEFYSKQSAVQTAWVDLYLDTSLTTSSSSSWFIDGRRIGAIADHEGYLLSWHHSLWKLNAEFMLQIDQNNKSNVMNLLELWSRLPIATFYNREFPHEITSSCSSIQLSDIWLPIEPKSSLKNTQSVPDIPFNNGSTDDAKVEHSDKSTRPLYFPVHHGYLPIDGFLFSHGIFGEPEHLVLSDNDEIVSLLSMEENPSDSFRLVLPSVHEVYFRGVESILFVCLKGHGDLEHLSSSWLLQRPTHGLCLIVWSYPDQAHPVLSLTVMRSSSFPLRKRISGEPLILTESIQDRRKLEWCTQMGEQRHCDDIMTRQTVLSRMIKVLATGEAVRLCILNSANPCAMSYMRAMSRGMICIRPFVLRGCAAFSHLPVEIIWLTWKDVVDDLCINRGKETDIWRVHCSLERIWANLEHEYLNSTSELNFRVFWVPCLSDSWGIGRGGKLPDHLVPFRNHIMLIFYQKLLEFEKKALVRYHNRVAVVYINPCCCDQITSGDDDTQGSVSTELKCIADSLTETSTSTTQIERFLLEIQESKLNMAVPSHSDGTVKNTSPDGIKIITLDLESHWTKEELLDDICQSMLDDRDAENKIDLLSIVDDLERAGVLDIVLKDPLKIRLLLHSINDVVSNIDVSSLLTSPMVQVWMAENESCAIHSQTLVSPISNLLDVLESRILLPSIFLTDESALRVLPHLLVAGVPGSGKSLLVSEFVRLSNWNCRTITCSSILSKYIGEAEKKLTTLFDEAERESIQTGVPTMVVLDGAESLLCVRGNENSNSTDRLINQLLCILDGVKPLFNVSFLLVSSKPWLIDPAVLRPGRCGMHILTSYPDLEGFVNILHSYVSTHLKEGHNFTPTASLFSRNRSKIR